MWISFMDTALTFASHIVAATHLAPLKYGKKKTYLTWGVWAAIFLIFSGFVPPPHSWGPGFSASAFLMACLMHVALYLITTTGRIGERFFLILSYSAFFTSCCAVTRMFQVFILPDSDWLYLVIYGISLFLMLWLFLGELLPIFRQSAAYIGRAWRILSVLMALFIVALMTWFVFPSKITDYTIKQIGGLPMLILVMFTTYEVIFVCIRNIAAAERAKQMELQLKLLTTQVEAQTQSSDEARRTRHDLRHHNLALLALAEEGNMAELVRYLRSMTEAEHAAEIVWCENDTLSSILSVYVAKAAAAGDCLFLYTDGATEATNAHNELFGEERLLSALNAEPDSAPEELLSLVKTAIDSFVSGTPQFDDITMLCLKMGENPSCKS